MVSMTGVTDVGRWRAIGVASVRPTIRVYLPSPASLLDALSDVSDKVKLLRDTGLWNAIGASGRLWSYGEGCGVIASVIARRQCRSDVIRARLARV